MTTKHIASLLLVSSLLCGCQQRARDAVAKPQASAPSSSPEEVVVAPPPPKARRATESLGSDYGKSAGQGSRSKKSRPAEVEPTSGVDEAMERITRLLRDGMRQGEVLVVWFVDCTPNNAEHRLTATQAINSQYRTFAELSLEGAATDRLTTAIVKIGGSNQPLFDEPTRNFGEVVSTLDSFKDTSEDSEQTFAAISAAAEQYAAVRRKGTEVYFIVVTNEAGDDRDRMDATIANVKRLAIPVYVLGVPAPFGREQVGIGAPKSNDHFGPETITTEYIRLGFFDPRPGVELLDSGFGPYHLARLCEATGGSYFTARPTPAQKMSLRMASTQWPNASARQFDPQVMRRYRPTYVSAEDDRALLSANATQAALRDAAQLPPITFGAKLTQQFKPKNQADLVRQLTAAQKIPARLAPPLHTLHATLQRGEQARDKLREPRQQAGFDLAFGRACAALARVDGYNEMLAMQKREGTFQKPESKRWVLKASDTSAMSSGIDKLATRATKYLNRVVADHPNTPWALLAEEELRTPIGWKWIEE